jgi:hydroxymethylpyrimidine/phosphomethylpyrimidine kinase
MKSIRKALTIAGSDSGAGAGIQADLKTFAALGVYGTSAITAITAQNTVGVSAVFALSPKLVAAQIDAVIADIGAHAVKTGMLANKAIIDIVADKVEQHRFKNLIVDPVMVATSGDLLIKRNAVSALRARLLPLAAVVTPNISEAEELTGMELRTDFDIEEAARRIVKMGARSVVIKGGHSKGPALDIFFDGKQFVPLKAQRVRTKTTHGTGCSFSAAIAARLAKGDRMEDAVHRAKTYITAAIRAGFTIGSGHSPVHHFYQFWKKKE